MMNKIDENQAHKAIHYLAETDEQAALAKANVSYLDEKKKSIKAIHFLEAEGANGVREQKAYASDDYKAYIEEYKDAVYAFETLKNKRLRAQLTIDLFRSLNANRRQAGGNL